MNNENQYLPEDKDIIDQLKNLNLSSGPVQEVIGDIQIKSILRQRKTMVDLDKSNKDFSLVIYFFTTIQIVIAGLDFVLNVVDYENKIFSIFITILFVVSMAFILKEMKKIFR